MISEIQNIPDMCNNHVIIKDPHDRFMNFLPEGSTVYLVKQNTIGTVQLYHNRTLYFRCGSRAEQWFVRKDGRGFNGLRLILPTEGSLSHYEQKIHSDEYNLLLSRIEKLEHVLKDYQNFKNLMDL